MPKTSTFTPSKHPAGRSLLEAHFGALPHTPQEKLFPEKVSLDSSKNFMLFIKMKISEPFGSEIYLPLVTSH